MLFFGPSFNMSSRSFAKRWKLKIVNVEYSFTVPLYFPTVCLESLAVPFLVISKHRRGNDSHCQQIYYHRKPWKRNIVGDIGINNSIGAKSPLLHTLDAIKQIILTPTTHFSVNSWLPKWQIKTAIHVSFFTSLQPHFQHLIGLKNLLIPFCWMWNQHLLKIARLFTGKNRVKKVFLNVMDCHEMWDFYYDLNRMQLEIFGKNKLRDLFIDIWMSV